VNNYDIWFSMVKLSYKIKLELLKKLKNTEAIWYYSMTKSTYINEEIGEDKLKALLKSFWNVEKINSIKSIMERENIAMITYNDKLYPENLRNYEDSPAILFYKGNLEKLNKNKSVAIVGSRGYSYYGENVTRIVAAKLAEKNVNVISGMAKGIDSFAHTTSLKEGGYTCAVLGSGVDVIYPKSNTSLYHEITKNGCIISEFLPGTPPYAYNFPLRNRIISGISDLVIIVEASNKSGSLITASCALEQGKEVMAVPGSIFSENSKGTNKLIKDGAYPLTSVEDIFHILNISYVHKNERKYYFGNAMEEKIFSIVKYSPIHIDDILKGTNIDIKQLYEVLFELQLKNQITCLSGNYYVRIANSV